MNIKVKAFGICKDMMGARELTLAIEGKNVGDLRKSLISKYPEIAKLNSLFIAVNESYSEDDTPLNETDEVALIPPVSGG